MRSNNIWNSTMQNGLIMGIFFSASFLFSVSGISILGFLSFLLPAIILIFAYKFLIRYRDRDCGGAITYGHGLSYIILLFFFASVISAAVKFVYLRFINPEFLQETMGQSMLIVEQTFEQFKGKYPMDMDEIYKSFERMTDPLNYTLMATWVNIIISFFVGLVLAGIAKKDKSIFDDNQDNLPQNNF